MTARRPRALIVDDESTVRSLLARAFSDQGFEVETADDAAAALTRCLDPQPPDLLVTDLSMPGMSGLDLVMRVRAQAPRIALLAVSGFETMIVRARDAGVPTMKKPCGMKDVVAKGVELLPQHLRSAVRAPSTRPVS